MGFIFGLELKYRLFFGMSLSESQFHCFPALQLGHKK